MHLGFRCPIYTFCMLPAISLRLSGFFLAASVLKELCASLNKTFPSFLPVLKDCLKDFTLLQIYIVIIDN